MIQYFQFEKQTTSELSKMKIFVNQMHRSTVRDLRREADKAHTEYWEWGSHATRMAIQRKVPFGAVREAIEHGEVLEYNISNRGTRHVLLGFITSDGLSTKVALDLDEKRISTCYQNNIGDKHRTLARSQYLFNGSGGNGSIYRN